MGVHGALLSRQSMSCFATYCTPRISIGSKIASDANLGVTVGTNTVSLIGAQNGPHCHALTVGYEGFGGGDNLIQYKREQTNKGSLITDYSGSGSPHNNMQPSLYLNYIVKI